MDIVFLAYGLVFLALGLALMIWPTDQRHDDLAGLTRWLAAFALVHGMSEWLELWWLVHGEAPHLAMVRSIMLLASMLLFEFGRRLILASLVSDHWLQRWLHVWIHGVLLLGAAAVSGWGTEPVLRLISEASDLYGFSSTLLAGSGFILYGGCRMRRTQDQTQAASIQRTCQMAGAAFIVYGILGGLVEHQAGWASSSGFNQEPFHAGIGMSAQWFRAACALGLAVAVVYLLRIFYRERNQQLQQALSCAQSSLEEVERLGLRHQLLLDSVAEGLFGVDLEGTIIFINPAALVMLGFPREELLGRSMHSLIRHSHADGRCFQVADCATYQTMRDGQVRHVRHEHFWRKDGSSFPVEYRTAPMREQGRIVAAVVAFQNVTEFLRVQTELHQHRQQLEGLVAQRTTQLYDAEQTLRLILDASAAGLLGIDLEDRIMFVNPAGSRMLGYKEEELIGRHSHPSLHHHRADGSVYPAEECPLGLALQGGEPGQNDDDLFWRADGTPLPVATVMRPMRNNGQLIGAVVSFMDISHAKALEAERARSAAEVARLARLKSEFLANMSHEIRTPIHGLKAFLDLAIKRQDRLSPEKLHGYLENAKVSAHKLDQFVDEMLAMNRLHSGELINPRRVDVCDLVKSIHLSMTDTFNARTIRLVTTTSTTNCWVSVDVDLFGTMLRHLLGNACRFSPQGAEVRVHLQDAVIVRGSDAVDALELAVLDQGEGIPAEELESIFEPFTQGVRGANGAGGVGLGLSISREIMVEHGGTLHAENPPEGGSRLVCRIPRQLAWSYADRARRMTHAEPGA